MSKLRPNFFDLFSLPVKFEIDLVDLEQKYLQLQTKFHPDKSSLGDINRSIEINEANKTLSDNFLRACYILNLEGIDILNDENSVRLDFEMLEEVLELQEEIEQISEQNQVQILQNKINEKVTGLILTAVESLEQKLLNQAAKNLVEAKYLKKSLKDLNTRKQKLRQ